jgi:hypothetical protein
MEGFSFVTPVTGLNRHNTGKEDDDVFSILKFIHQQKLFRSPSNNTEYMFVIVILLRRIVD